MFGERWDSGADMKGNITKTFNPGGERAQEQGDGLLVLIV